MKKILGLLLIVFSMFIINDVYAENLDISTCEMNYSKNTQIVFNKIDTKIKYPIKYLEEEKTNEKNVGDNFCSTKNVLMVLRIAGFIILLAKLIIPIIIIYRGSLEFFKTVREGTADSLKTQAKSFGIRVALGILIFFIPTLINVFLKSIDGYSDLESEINGCRVCMLEPTSCDPMAFSEQEETEEESN